MCSVSICPKQQRQKRDTDQIFKSINIFAILENFWDMIWSKIWPTADFLDFGAIRSPDFEILVIMSKSTIIQVRKIDYSKAG